MVRCVLHPRKTASEIESLKRLKEGIKPIAETKAYTVYPLPTSNEQRSEEIIHFIKEVPDHNLNAVLPGLTEIVTLLESGVVEVVGSTVPKQYIGVGVTIEIPPVLPRRITPINEEEGVLAHVVTTPPFEEKYFLDLSGKNLHELMAIARGA